VYVVVRVGKLIRGLELGVNESHQWKRFFGLWVQSQKRWVGKDGWRQSAIKKLINGFLCVALFRWYWNITFDFKWRIILTIWLIEIVGKTKVWVFGWNRSLIKKWTEWTRTLEITFTAVGLNAWIKI
jgi:hypothetical protein